MISRHFVEAVIRDKGWKPYISGHWINFRSKGKSTGGVIITFVGHTGHEFRCSNKVASEILAVKKEAQMRTGWTATSGDGGTCGHHHHTRQTAGRCIRSQIYGSRQDVKQEAAEHGETYRAYVARWVDDAVYYQDADGNLYQIVKEAQKCRHT